MAASYFNMTDPFYNPVDSRPQPPAWWYPTLWGAYIFSCILPSWPSFLRAALTLPIIATLCIYAPNYSFGDTILNFTAGILGASHIIKYFDFVVFGNPEEAFWRVADRIPRPKTSEKANGLLKENAKGTANWHANGHTQAKPEAKTDPKAKIAPKPEGGFIERVRWAVSLWSTTRGVGWSWRVANLPMAEIYTSRVKFLLATTHQILVAKLAIDTVLTILATTPFAGPTDTRASIFNYPLLERTAIVWMVGIESYQGMNLTYYQPAILTVITGICRPEQWPSMFGSFRKDAWSVRYLWGVVWHQMLRSSIHAPVDFLVRVLRVPRGTLISRYSQLILGFVVSSVIHHAGAFMLLHNSGWQYHLWAAQCGIIILEDLVIYLGKKAGIRDSGFVRVLGYVWVFLWISSIYTGVTAANLFLSAGHANDEFPWGFSMISGIKMVDNCNTFWMIFADRWAVCIMLWRVLYVLQIKKPVDMLKVVPSVGLVAVLWWATKTDDNRLDLMVKGAGLVWSVVDVKIHGL